MISDVSFDGFPVAALDFYDDLEQDNSKAFWDAHRSTYEESVRAPFEARLVAQGDRQPERRDPRAHDR